jgi:hypothetical protein
MKFFFLLGHKLSNFHENFTNVKRFVIKSDIRIWIIGLGRPKAASIEKKVAARHDTSVVCDDTVTENR